MLQMLVELTQGCFFRPMSEFKQYILNGEEVLKAINTDNCVEFGTFNGQEMFIYGLTANGRKYICYSCTLTKFYNYLVLENAYSTNGNEYTMFNWDKWYNLAEQKAATANKEV